MGGGPAQSSRQQHAAWDGGGGGSGSPWAASDGSAPRSPFASAGGGDEQPPSEHNGSAGGQQQQRGGRLAAGRSAPERQRVDTWLDEQLEPPQFQSVDLEKQQRRLRLTAQLRSLVPKREPGAEGEAAVAAERARISSVAASMRFHNADTCSTPSCRFCAYRWSLEADGDGDGRPGATPGTSRHPPSSA